MVAVNWLLREDELAQVKAISSQVKISGEGGAAVVTLLLPMSKTDQTGIGAARTLGHECRNTASRVLSNKWTCPVCAVLRQLDRLRSGWSANGEEGLDNLELPLFPTPGGSRPSKQVMIAAWGHAWREGGDTPPATRHSARRTGAKRRAKMGWSL